MPAVHLASRPWVPTAVDQHVTAIARHTCAQSPEAVVAEVEALALQNQRIHDIEGINLNPASNVMNPRAEALLAARLGPRASLGYPGDKYETGLEAIERIEVIAAELAAGVFGAKYAEVRVGSGALANLYVFMATCRPGDTIVAPPPEIGGHVTHHRAGAAGLYDLNTIAAPIDAANYTVDVDALRRLVREVRPRLVTLGGSLNLYPHPVADVRAICDEVGATLLFDAAHLSGMFAGHAWESPLALGAHAMTMSTYKSLGGPPGGLVLTNDAALAEKLDAIAYPGLTANADPGRTAALAVCLADWRAQGTAYAQAMVATAQSLAAQLVARGLPIYGDPARSFTLSHQLALPATTWGGGQAAAKRLAAARLYACGIGLPDTPASPPVTTPGETSGLRLGVPEIVRLGMGPAQMPELARLIAGALDLSGNPARLAAEVTALRSRFAPDAKGLRFIIEHAASDDSGTS
jgi:glycine hydroxymethyltransferase